jgi:hypothetical protein
MKLRTSRMLYRKMCVRKGMVCGVTERSSYTAVMFKHFSVNITSSFMNTGFGFISGDGEAFGFLLDDLWWVSMHPFIYLLRLWGVAERSEAQPLGTWAPNALEAWMFVRVSCVFVLSCVQGVLPTACKIRSSRLIVMGNRPRGLIRKVEKTVSRVLWRILR